jgi:hypothetical protein
MLNSTIAIKKNARRLAGGHHTTASLAKKAFVCGEEDKGMEGRTPSVDRVYIMARDQKRRIHEKCSLFITS